MSQLIKMFVIAFSVPTILGVPAVLADDKVAQEIATSTTLGTVNSLPGETQEGSITFLAGDTERGTATFLAGDGVVATGTVAPGDYRSINNTVDGEFGP